MSIAAKPASDSAYGTCRPTSSNGVDGGAPVGSTGRPVRCSAWSLIGADMAALYGGAGDLSAPLWVVPANRPAGTEPELRPSPERSVRRTPAPSEMTSENWHDIRVR